MKKNAMRILIIFLIIVMTPFPAFAVNEDFIPIQIDGDYDDWEDKPSTEVYPGHNPPESKINYVSLFRDEDSVYIHVTFAYKNNQDITNMIINLYTNMGDENYFLVPDFFWDIDTQSEPDVTLDQSTDISPLEQAPTETTNSTEQNLLAGQELESYLLVADNEKSDPATDPGTVDTDTNSVTTDEKTNNGLGNGSDNKAGSVTEPNDSGTNSESETGSTGNGDINPDNPLETLDPDKIVDLNNVLDQFTTDAVTDTGVTDDSAEMNSNLDLKKPGRYGTWGFSVWDGLFPVGNGYYTRSEGEPDELELYIPLSSVNRQHDGITEISMRIKKLGPQQIMCTGVSSGAYIGVAAGAGIALVSIGVYTYKRKRPFILGKGQ